MIYHTNGLRSTFFGDLLLRTLTRSREIMFVEKPKPSVLAEDLPFPDLHSFSTYPLHSAETQRCLIWNPRLDLRAFGWFGLWSAPFESYFFSCFRLFFRLGWRSIHEATCSFLKGMKKRSKTQRDLVKANLKSTRKDLGSYFCSSSLFEPGGAPPPSLPFLHLFCCCLLFLCVVIACFVGFWTPKHRETPTQPTKEEGLCDVEPFGPHITLNIQKQKQKQAYQNAGTKKGNCLGWCGARSTLNPPNQHL